MCPIAQRPVLCAASYEQHTDRTTRKKSETKRSATAEIERRSTARLRCNGKPSIHTLPGTECSLHDLYPYRTLPDGCVALSHDGPKNTPQMKISARVDQRTHSTGSARLSSARLALTKERLETKTWFQERSQTSSSVLAHRTRSRNTHRAAPLRRGREAEAATDAPRQRTPKTRQTHPTNQ